MPLNFSNNLMQAITSVGTKEMVGERSLRKKSKFWREKVRMRNRAYPNLYRGVAQWVAI